MNTRGHLVPPLKGARELSPFRLDRPPLLIQLSITHKWCSGHGGRVLGSASTVSQPPTPRSPLPRAESGFQTVTASPRGRGVFNVSDLDPGRRSLRFLALGYSHYAPLGLKGRSQCNSPFPPCPEESYGTCSAYFRRGHEGGEFFAATTTPAAPPESAEHVP